eukprot:2504891-Pleurochrysis_carterae.AAC.1
MHVHAHEDLRAISCTCIRATEHVCRRMRANQKALSPSDYRCANDQCDATLGFLSACITHRNPDACSLNLGRSYTLASNVRTACILLRVCQLHSVETSAKQMRSWRWATLHRCVCHAQQVTGSEAAADYALLPHSLPFSFTVFLFH